MPYFDGRIDTLVAQNVTVPDQLIQKGDILNIVIYSDNPEATAIFNQASVAGAGATASSGSSGPDATSGGYLVDNKGNIRLHALGLLPVGGLTKQQVESQIIAKINEMNVLTNPYCIVRLSNFSITILGEVNAPGVKIMPAEKATILEALGKAGDINMYGRKDRVMLIREDQGKRTYTTLDLTNSSIFSSPYFYLRQNDVLVIQADKRKMTPADQNSLQFIALGFTAISTLAIFLSLIRL